ncbi:cysteine desulfurase family protein [Lapidilactobacillus wuchangensis]|uniref:cysteine desulfurase family protein n=1 Tax=Lapidilactobacillus wuchangensis TaxID=2486001 RepID=UPI000F7940EB|nr:aminotransferase class V-fold PLP-dependent enzyme [Lapidilactobacillus wuchangensis]
MIYFDHAATTKMSLNALQTYQEVAAHFFANSESLHQAGNAAGQLIQEARQQLASTFQLNPEGIIFTSGGTEANEVGIKALARGTNKPEILVSPLEHASVYQVLNELATRDNYQIRKLPVDQHGHITAATLAAAITPATGLIVIQAVNPITGVTQDIDGLQAVAATKQRPLFVDAVQGIAKIPLNLHQLAGFSASAHKFNGPKSCGFLYLAPDYPATPEYQNVFQQQGFLPGTLDTPGIISMLTALTESLAAMPASLVQLQKLRQHFYQSLAPSCRRIGDNTDYPGICGLLLPKLTGQEVATRLGQQGICLSTVSACSIKDPRPDPTLTALGLTTSEAERYLRISFGPENTLTEVDQMLTALTPYV